MRARLHRTARAAALALAVAPAPAAAFFGPACVPVVQNCFCTYMIPCPVNDSLANARAALNGADLESARTMMQSIKNPRQAALKALRGDFSNAGIPGLDSIGVDPTAVLNGDISSLSGVLDLPPEIVGLSEDLTAAGIDRRFVTSLADGEITPEQFLDLAQKNGLGIDGLDAVGVTTSDITKLVSGELSPSEALDMATRLGMRTDVLRAYGISEQTLIDMAEGDMSLAEFQRMAWNSGLTDEALAKAGLDRATLEAIARGPDPSELVGHLSQAGFDRSGLTALGIDPTSLAAIASGEMSSDQIATIAAGAGLAPDGIVAPGAGGTVARAESGGRAATADMISIPTSSVPGLDEAIAAGGGSPAPRPAPRASRASQAMCNAETTLISARIPPNALGTDPGTIDMAISGGNLEAFAENRDAARTAARTTMVRSYARSIVQRPVITRALDSVDSFRTMMSQTTSLQDDFVVNDTIKSHLMAAKAETTSLLTALLSTRAAALIDDVNSPTPVGAGDARFLDAIEERVVAPAREKRREAETLASASRDYTALVRGVDELLLQKNLVHDAARIQEGLPEVRATINRHETLKSALFTMEQVIRERLDTLYDEPAEDIWALLRPELVAQAGSYTDTGKWAEGAGVARTMSMRIAAQSRSTPYGTRTRAGVDEDGRPVYTAIGLTPTRYDFVPRGGPFAEDMRTVSNSTLPQIDPDRGRVETQYRLFGAIQVYLSLVRRTDFAGTLRRGQSGQEMTSLFWNEMRTNAPRCLAGPLPATDANISRRPDLFDLSPDCDHLVWSYGDPGDYIDASELGGADATLWLSKITLARIRSRTGGADAVQARIARLIEEVEDGTLKQSLRAIGHDGDAAKVSSLLERLSVALSDTGFASHHALPPVR